jgi:hypothetical protein
MCLPWCMVLLTRRCETHNRMRSTNGKLTPWVVAAAVAARGVLTQASASAGMTIRAPACLHVRRNARRPRDGPVGLAILVALALLLLTAAAAPVEMSQGTGHVIRCDYGA